MPALARREFLAGLATGALGNAMVQRRAGAAGSGIIAIGHADPAGVSLLDPGRGEPLAFLPLSHEPAQLLVDPFGRRLLASDYDNGISRISLAGHPEARYLPLPFMPVHMQATPRWHILAINGLTEEGMWLADPDRPQAGRRIRGLSEPHNFRFDRAARRLLVADRGGRGIAVVDVARAAAIGAIGTGVMGRMPAAAVPDQLAVSADERTVLLVCDGCEQVAAIPVDGGEPHLGPALGGQPARPRADRRGRFFLVEIVETSELVLLAPDGLQVMARLPLGGGPALLAQLWFDQLLAVAAEGGSRLFLFDLERRETVAEHSLPGGIGGLVAGAAGDRLFLLLDAPARVLGLRLPDLEERELGPLAGPTRMAATAGSPSFCG